MTPYVALDHPSVRLYLGDCVDGMTSMPAGSVSVVVTSPPYNIGIQYQTYDDSRPREEYLAWIERVGLAVRRVLEPDGSFFLNVGGRPADPWIPWDVAGRLRQHFALQNVIHWIKSVAIDRKDVGNYPGITRDVAVGHYKPINSPRFLHDCHEYIFHFTKEGHVELDRLAIGVKYQDKTNIGRWKAADQDRRCRGNTWFLPYKTIRDRASQRPHPSTFPVQLPDLCIRLHGVGRTSLVLDPFMGLGSTAMAARALGRACVGFDIDRDYLDVAREKLSESRPTGDPAVQETFEFL
jgi:site-specific DNA-methyltransferase (adenine-specific)